MKTIVENELKQFMDPKLISWLKNNIDSNTQMPYSFYIPVNEREQAYARMGKSHSLEGIIERVIVAEGLNVYDGAVAQMVLTLLGGEENWQLAYKPVEIYWNGAFGDFTNIRAGYPLHSYIYDPQNPESISSDLADKGRRGFVFRIINAKGNYLTVDPLDGKQMMEDFPTHPMIHWEDWKPIAGENAWVVMAALQLYHRKYFNEITKRYRDNLNSIELRLAEELARAALLLQAENGGIRMAPQGTYRKPDAAHTENIHLHNWWYNQISSENNISWYAAFRMLYQITKKSVYKEAMEGIESYFQITFNESENYFYQGMHFDGEQWKLNDEYYALDVQTWGIAAFGPKEIDEWFGFGTSFRIWETAKKYSGSFDTEGRITGVGYTKDDTRVSVEWSAGAILALKILTEYYQYSNPSWAYQTFIEAQDMRGGIEALRYDISEEQAAYAYSSKRGWIPFGWYSHSPEVLSLASTGWVILVDLNFNPFFLP